MTSLKFECFGGFGGEQFEKLLLRNDDDAIAPSRIEDRRQFEADGRTAVPDIHAGGENVAQREDPLAQVQIAEYSIRARLKQFAAELARECRGLLQNRHAYSASAEKQREHQAGRPAADDDHLRIVHIPGILAEAR